MKINKIAKICKAEKKICVLPTEDGPWLGTRAAMYFLPSLQGIGEEGIYAIFNVSEKEKKDIPIEYLNSDELDITDINPKAPDIETEEMKLKLSWGGESMMCLIGRGAEVRVLFSAHTAPLSPDVDFYYRGNKVYAKRGMCIVAVLEHIMGFPEELLNELEYIKSSVEEKVR